MKNKKNIDLNEMKGKLPFREPDERYFDDLSQRVQKRVQASPSWKSSSVFHASWFRLAIAGVSVCVFALIVFVGGNKVDEYGLSGSNLAFSEQYLESEGYDEEDFYEEDELVNLLAMQGSSVAFEDFIPAPDVLMNEYELESSEVQSGMQYLEDIEVSSDDLEDFELDELSF